MEFRSKTHEMYAFWHAWPLGHDRHDPEIRAADFPDLEARLVRTLFRSGFTCRRQLQTCPDWLLLTVTNLGAKGVVAIRATLPFDVSPGFKCPGRSIEVKKSRQRLAAQKSQAS